MLTRLRLLPLLAVFLLTSTIEASKPTSYQKGWESFLKNDRKTARILFTEATKMPATKADAFLSLSLLDWMDQKEDNAFESFRSFYQNSTTPYPYLYGLFTLPFTFASRDFIAPQRLAFLEQLSSDPKLNGTLKAMVNCQLGNYAFFVNNRQKANEYFAKMGSVNHWQVVGEFDNISGSGFTKDWNVVDKPLVTDTFTNKVRATIKWYTPPYNRPDNWFSFDYYFSLNNIIAYAQSFVKSPVEQEVYMRTGTSGSLKIWVNDALVASVPEERNCDLDIYGYKVKLNKGTNRILVQIGQSDISAANFLLRLTDADGNPIQGLNDEAVYSEYTKAAPSSPQSMLPFFAETYFEDKIKTDPENAINYLLLAEVYLRNDKAFEATEILKQLEVRSPNSSLISYRLSEAYIRAKNQTDYDKEKENIKRNDPESFMALQEFFNDAIRSEKFTEATAIFEKAKTLYGDNLILQGWELSLASKQKRIEDIIALGRKFYALYPYNYEFMYLNWAIENNISKNSPQATSVVEDFCKKYFVARAYGMLSGIYMEQGKTNEAINILKERISAMPYASGFLDNLSSTYYKMQRYDEALKTNDLTLKLSPYMANVYNSRGYIFKGMKDEAKAKESFSRAIYYDPTSYDSRSQLRLLENKKEVFELFPKNNLPALIAKTPTAQDYPEDNAVIVLNNNELVVYPEGAKEYHTEIAIKILNQAGIDAWKQYGIGYNSNSQKLIIAKAEVLKSSGNVIKAESSDNQVVFTNLEIGDVLHLDYRIQDFSSGELATQFFDQFPLRYTMPSILSQYSILVPKGQTFKYMVANGTTEPTISEVEGMKLYTWKSENQPALKRETYMSSLYDLVPTLFFSSIPDWKFVGNWYRDLTTSKFWPDYVLKETRATILKGHEQDSQLQKAKLFYDYILRNITYSSVPFMQSNFVPQKASRTITTRLGDCKDMSTLFVALCRESGIDANLVLISTRDNGRNLLTLPTINFNHCIAQLNIEGKTYYLELTDSHLPFGAAESMDLEANILPIPFGSDAAKDKLLKMGMSFRPQNATLRYNKVTFNDNDFLITHHSTYYASTASSIRNAYRDLGEEERVKNLTQSIAADYKTPVKITDLNFTNLDNLSDSVMMTCTLEIKKAIQDVAGMKVLSMPWFDKFSSMEDLSLEKRNTPFELWAFFGEEENTESIELVLPQGLTFVETPKDLHLECANASYDITFRKSGNGNLVGTRIFRRKSEIVTPEQYNSFRQFMEQVNETDNKQYAVK